jgi:hypothetical protein
MKYVLASIVVFALLFSSNRTLAASADSTLPRWLSDKGYWMIESKIQSPDTSLVHFFTNEGILVYQEKIEGERLNLRKMRIRMQLKKVLEASLTAYKNREKIQPGMLTTLLHK